MNKTPHVHKLRRLKYKSGNVIFFCTLPDCTYKITPALSLGKRAICNRCGEEFIMNEYSIRLAKPHCEKCHKSKSDGDGHFGVSIIEETIKEIKTIPSLAEKLQQTIAQAAQKTDEDI